MIHHSFIKLFVLSAVFRCVVSLPEKGKWDFPMLKGSSVIGLPRSLFQGSEIFIQISCESASSVIEVQWKVIESQCYDEFLNLGEDGLLRNLKIMESMNPPLIFKYNCSDHIMLYETSKISTPSPNSKLPVDPASVDQKPRNSLRTVSKAPVYIVDKDGVYLLTLGIYEIRGPLNVTVHVEMKGPHGYLNAAEWPLLPFYACMCVVYVVFAVVWLTVSFLQWRDLLRIQFWIGAVILIGMIEKALFYEEYQSINSTGESSLLGTVFIAEMVSAAKRSLARMLVIIVSFGYGIVKPTLGSHLSRILFVGFIYFLLASTEAYLRVVKSKNDPSNYLLLASIPLALLNSFICWWIFSSLVQTTRTLRLRRNLVKLRLYTHFTNTLIFAVIASTIFMLYSIKIHRLTECLTDWKSLWIDDAFWHLLFSLILLVIMILSRPTNNNQRYAFSPLLDIADDEYDDDEEVEHFVNDAYGVKMRGLGSQRSDSPKLRNNVDDDLTWVEENIPSSFIDSNLPILDSDEELMNTKFELSKME